MVPPPHPTLLPTTHPTVLSPPRLFCGGGWPWCAPGRFVQPRGALCASLRARISPPPPPSRTKWTRRVPHPVLIGHAASLTPYNPGAHFSPAPYSPDAHLSPAPRRPGARGGRREGTLASRRMAEAGMVWWPWEGEEGRGRVMCVWCGGVEEVALPPPPSRTKWTRRVPHPVLIGHAASLAPY